MKTDLHFSIHGMSVFAVPSVHFRMAFAEEVNRLCAAEKPDAVAVELGPQTARAATEWIRELCGEGNGSSATFPNMLGITRPNRRIRPSKRAEAIRLQKMTGKELHELPPEILLEALDYSELSVLYLSPTDSIIEAIRCANELKVPLYGVDLEETAACRRQDIMLPDPAIASQDMASYVAQNGGFSEHHRDEEIDHRREVAMAARLKSLAAKHKKIVFVCGLAHWRCIRTLVDDSGIAPAIFPVDEPLNYRLFQRVIVHPSLAIHYIDTFPAYAEVYEDCRRHVSRRHKYHQELDVHRLFNDMLLSAYEKYFIKAKDTGEQIDRCFEDLEAKNDFEQLLWNLTTIRQRKTPDIFTTLSAAQGIMSSMFCKILGEVLMKSRWVQPDAFPDLPILAPSPSPAGTPVRAEYVEPNGNRSRWFYLHSIPARSGIPISIPVPWEWKCMPKKIVERERDGIIANWLPLEALFTAYSLRAVSVAQEDQSQSHTEPFEGSIQDGFEMKSTLRSAARGEDRIFVRVGRRKPQTQAEGGDEMDGFPLVWIFRLMESASISWKFSSDGFRLLRVNSKNKAMWDKYDLNYRFISSLMAVTGSHIDQHLSRNGYNVISETRVGQLSYHPQCCVKRTAEWAMETHFSRNPYCPEATFEILSKFYRERFSFEIGDYPWHVNLIRMAIPYATKAVTVAAPDGYVLPSVAYQEAARKGVQLRIVPLSFFPAMALRKMSELTWMPTLDRTNDEIDLPTYPEHVHRHYNEPVDTNLRLIPPKWR
jgi:hypothetical protein